MAASQSREHPAGGPSGAPHADGRLRAGGQVHADSLLGQEGATDPRGSAEPLPLFGPRLQVPLRTAFNHAARLGTSEPHTVLRVLSAPGAAHRPVKTMIPRTLRDRRSSRGSHLKSGDDSSGSAPPPRPQRAPSPGRSCSGTGAPSPARPGSGRIYKNGKSGGKAGCSREFQESLITVDYRRFSFRRALSK